VNELACTPGAEPEYEYIGTDHECTCNSYAEMLNNMSSTCFSTGQYYDCVLHGDKYVLRDTGTVVTPKLNEKLMSHDSNTTILPKELECSPTGILQTKLINASTQCVDTKPWCAHLPVDILCTVTLFQLDCPVTCNSCDKVQTCNKTAELLTSYSRKACDGTACDDVQTAEPTAAPISSSPTLAPSTRMPTTSPSPAPSMAPTDNCQSINIVDDSAIGLDVFAGVQDSSVYHACNVISLVWKVSINESGGAFHLAVSPVNQIVSGVEFYEIAVRQSSGRTWLRRVADGNRYAAVAQGYLTASNAPRVYWFTLDKGTGAIAFGEGDSIGQNVVLTYTDSEPLEVNFVLSNFYCWTDACKSQETNSIFNFCPVEGTCAPTSSPSMSPSMSPTVSPSATLTPTQSPTTSPTAYMEPFLNFYFDEVETTAAPSPCVNDDKCAVIASASAPQLTCIEDCDSSTADCTKYIGAADQCECEAVAAKLVEGGVDCYGEGGAISCMLFVHPTSNQTYYVLADQTGIMVNNMNDLLQAANASVTAPKPLKCAPLGQIITAGPDITNLTCVDEDWCPLIPDAMCQNLQQQCPQKCNSCPSPSTCDRTAQLLSSYAVDTCDGSSICTGNRRRAMKEIMQIPRTLPATPQVPTSKHAKLARLDHGKVKDGNDDLSAAMTISLDLVITSNDLTGLERLNIERSVHDEISQRCEKPTAVTSSKKKKTRSQKYIDEIANVTLINIIDTSSAGGVNRSYQVRVDFKSSATLEFVADLLESYRGKPMVIAFASGVLQSKHMSVKVFQMGGTDDVIKRDLGQDQMEASSVDGQGALASSPHRSLGITIGICLSVLAIALLSLVLVLRLQQPSVKGATAV